MRNAFPVEDLARDARFVQVPLTERFNDPRTSQPAGTTSKRGPGRLTPDRADAPDAARALMHGIFTGEIQALEGAGRTCWDFEVGPGAVMPGLAMIQASATSAGVAPSRIATTSSAPRIAKPCGVR
jgi:hypothetical protein